MLLVARDEEQLLEAADECAAAGEEAGGQAESWPATSPSPRRPPRVVAEAEERLGQLDVLVNSAGTARWRDLDEVPDEDWYAAWELNVMAPMRLMRAAVPAMRERGWGRVVNVSSTAGKRPSAAMPEYSVAKAAELSLSRLYADRCAADGVLVNAICPGPVKSELWMEPGGLLDQSKEMGGYEQPRGGPRGGGRQAADRAARRGRGDRRRDRLPLLRARLLRRRRRLERRRRHRPGDHLGRDWPPDRCAAGSVPPDGEAALPTSSDPAEASRMDAAGGRTEAAVLIPMHGWPDNPGLVFTERRGDLRRHAGEVSFPGGRRDPGEELLETALREAEEEIGLDRERVEIAGCPAAGGHLRHRLQGPPLRRPDRGGAALRARTPPRSRASWSPRSTTSGPATGSAGWCAAGCRSRPTATFWATS